jgi:hypothetical protein
MRNRLWALVFVMAALSHAHADAVALLLEEPVGTFGSIFPTGHAAVYLTKVCVASPTRLRRCELGEAGVVITRYPRIAGLDWLAIPLLPYLYAVESPQEILAVASAQSVAALKDEYRRTHLLEIVPGDAEGRTPKGAWVQLIGSAYDRKIYGFRIATSQEQDDAFIKHFNNRRNKGRFNPLLHNCADLARTVLNFYYPHAINRNFFADAGITTPKQVAKSLVSYCRHHPNVPCSSFAIPQVEGSIHRSEPAHGVFEMLLKTKKYVIPLAIMMPPITGGLALLYLTEGRFNPEDNAEVFDIARALQSQSASVETSMVAAPAPARLDPAIALKAPVR